MSLERNFRIGLSWTGLFGLAFALWHCSPIAPSVSKSQLTSGSEPAGKVVDAPPFHGNSLVALNFSAKVLDSESYVDALLLLQESSDFQLLSLSVSQLSELAQTKKTVLNLPGPLGGSIPVASVFLEVSLRRASLQRLALAEIEVSLSPAQGSAWTLAVLPASDPDKAKLLELALSTLESASVAVGRGEPRQKIASKRPPGVTR